MKSNLSRAEFSAELLAQEELLDDGAFDGQRREILARLAEAERREGRSRRMALGISAGALVVLLGVQAVSFRSGAFYHPENLPEWAVFALAISAILAAAVCFIVAALYLLRYRRPVMQLRRAAEAKALEALPREVQQLRRELEAMRAKLAAGPSGGEKSASGPGAGKDGGFTLMEMLTTVVVLGILASLSFPALARAKSRARGAVCKSNLSQIGKALAVYEADYHYLPGAGEAGQIEAKARDGARASTNSWIAKISPGLGPKPGVWLCPEYAAPVLAPGLRTDAFGYNAGGSAEMFQHMEANLGLGYGETNFVSSAQVQSPAEMVAAGDMQLVPGFWGNVITPQTKPIGWLTLVPSRHGGGANMLFVDSHVEWQRQAAWTAETPRARARWNIDHLPHPETWK